MAGLSRTMSRLNNNEMVQKLRAHLPELNFITIHYLYFIVLCLITSLIFYGSSNPKFSISYTDSLFLVVSAMTEAGLNTVNLSTMTTFQQVILWFLIVAGSSIFVSIFTVLTRKHYFEVRFKDFVKRQKEARRVHRRSMSEVRLGTGRERSREGWKTDGPHDESVFEGRHSEPRDPTARPVSSSPALAPKLEGGSEPSLVEETTVLERARSPLTADPDHISFMRYVPPSQDGHALGHSRVLSFAGVGAHPMSTSVKYLPTEGLRGRGQGEKTVDSEADGEALPHWQYPHYLTRHTTGRNAQFYGLSKAEREHLGGVEYRAITLLAYVVPIYFILWQLLGCLGLAAYFAHNKPHVARGNGINPWWLGVFNGASAFNNSGMSLLDANMIPFNTAVYPLLTMGIMILAGNTAYPLFLRFILWSLLKLLNLLYPSDLQYSDHKATLRFVLRYPRRVYTNLFPSAPTWWLLATVVILNGIDWAAFEVLNIGNPAVAAIPPHFRVLDGLFQALAVRSGGFYIISIPTLRIGLQVLYVIMMYISVYPVVITMRHSNVYEERSLGIYTDEDHPSTTTTSDEESATDPPDAPARTLRRFGRTLTRTLTSHIGIHSSASVTTDTGAQFVRQQIRGQLAHDLWLLVLAILFISIIEVSNFDRDPVTYSIFNIVFEVISGYGCVGISTGLPNEAYSFSGGWHVGSKLILIAVMLRGRHRGLPVALDRAVQLLGAEEEDADAVGRVGEGKVL